MPGRRRYRPADLTPSGGPTYGYWMFEGLLTDRNARLHVTSTHCDDPVALALAGGSRTALSLHGCTAWQAGATGDGQAVVVGGLDAEFRRVTRTALQGAGFRVVDGADVPSSPAGLPATSSTARCPEAASSSN
ncbi:poly-gamma-glutamate hydrolase family protein [Yinghuangia aomiensis]